MERIHKDRILRVWSLIVFRKGKSKYKKDIPKLILITGSNKTQIIGRYLPYENSILVWCKSHYDFKELTSTILHEYTHYLQFWPWYQRYAKIYTYKENPYEIEANLSESEAPSLIKEISENRWKINVKNQEIRMIYESADDSVIVKF